VSTIRVPERVWMAVYNHLFSRPGEHFAFMLAQWTYSRGTPVFMVRDVILIPDEQVTVGRDGWELTTDAIVEVINTATRSGDTLIEAHNHGGLRPRFSRTDRDGFKEFTTYVFESLPGRPYAATVWADSTIYGEFFLPDGSSGALSSISVIGDRLRQVVSRDDDADPVAAAFDRQLPWFTEEGQRSLARLRMAIVGAGGTGSLLIQNLVYLGIRQFVLVEDDDSDTTSMNRLVTAMAADLDTPKSILGRRLIKSVAPNAVVEVIPSKLQSRNALDVLKGVDIVFGCVDNDGARLVLNELALAYGIPYFDLAVGIDAEHGEVLVAGGRVAIVLPGGSCLYCMGQIDAAEARFFLSSAEEQATQRARGYVRGMDVPAPAVISLNATIAAAATNEFAIFISGLRPVNIYTDLDLLGTGRTVKGQWMTPTGVRALGNCVQCSIAGAGDSASIERYGSGA